MMATRKVPLGSWCRRIPRRPSGRDNGIMSGRRARQLSYQSVPYNTSIKHSEIAPNSDDGIDKRHVAAVCTCGDEHRQNPR